MLLICRLRNLAMVIRTYVLEFELLFSVCGSSNFCICCLRFIWLKNNWII